MTRTDPTLLLRVEDLSVSFSTSLGEVTAVEDLSLSIAEGEKLCVVGESGSGKSELFLAIAGLLARNGRARGSAIFRGRQLVGASPADLRQVLGDRLTFVFQDPMTALTPHLTIGAQLQEVLARSGRVDRRRRRALAEEMLRRVRLPDAARRMREYPHQLSGGMRQRVLIAMALLTAPDLVIADEPTTALDVTVQAEIMELLRELGRESPMALVMVTHDIGLVADIAERIVIMYAGRVVEEGSVELLLSDPRHPYTRGLLASVPRLDQPAHTELHGIGGQPPSPLTRRQGCMFAPRCAHRSERCMRVRPELRTLAGRQLACHVDLACAAP